MDLRAILSWSCQQLSGPAAELFLLLGAHQEPDISAAAAARLAGITHTRARHLLAELAGVSLLTEHAPDRFTFNDLLRAYAAERALADRRPRLSRSGQGSRGS